MQRGTPPPGANEAKEIRLDNDIILRSNHDTTAAFLRARGRESGVTVVFCFVSLALCIHPSSSTHRFTSANFFVLVLFFPIAAERHPLLF
jgi:hypothetical protein